MSQPSQPYPPYPNGQGYPAPPPPGQGWAHPGYPPQGAYPGQPPYPPPGAYGQGPVFYPQGMPPLPPRKSPVRWILLGVGVAVAIAVAGGVVAAVNALKHGDTDSNAFISSLESGNTAAAYLMFSPELQQKQDQMTFESGVAKLTLSPSCTMNWTRVSVNTGTSGTTKETDGTLTCPNAPYPSYAVSLGWIKQNGVYKLSMYHITP